MKLTLNGFNEDQFRWCFWAAGSDGPGSDTDDGGSTSAGSSSSTSSDRNDGGNDSPFGSTSGRSIGSSNANISGGRGDSDASGDPSDQSTVDFGGGVDRVAVASPNTGRVNMQNFNTSDRYTAGMSRVNINGQTVAVSPSAVSAVAAGRGGSSPVTNAIQSQIVGPAQALDQAQRAANLSSTFRSPVGTTTAAISPSPVGFSYDPYAGTVLDRSFLSRPSPELPSMSAMEYGLAMGVPTPVNLPNAYFDDGTQRGYFGPNTSGVGRLSFYDTPPTPDAEMGFFDRLASGFRSKFDNTPQALAGYEVDRFGNIKPTTEAMYKTSDNAFGDLVGNMMAGAMGASTFTGLMDTQQYMPYFGGTYTDPVTGEVVGTPREEYQYATAKGGLLSDYISGKLTPQSEIDARQAQMGGDGDGDQPLIIPQEVAEIEPETGEPTQFPEFTPREYKYQPYTAKFYSIPSRFTQPYGLLG